MSTFKLVIPESLNNEVLESYKANAKRCEEEKEIEETEEEN